MTEYIFRYANSFGYKPDEYERENNLDHYGTLHEEIVRCRDCMYKSRDGDWCCRTSHEFPVGDEGFCAWASRKEVIS